MKQAPKENHYNSLLEILEMISLKDDSSMLKEIDNNEIFELRDKEKNEFLGRYWSVDLANMLKSYPTLFSTNLETKQKDAAEWTSLITHPKFQRRRPEVVPNQDAPLANEYLVQIDSEIFGPIDHEEIEQKLKDNSLLFTDKISTDGGITWLPIFKRTEFDRRKRSSEQLPPSPESDIFALSQFEAMTNLIEKKENEQQECLNVIAGLAYIGQVHNGKIIAEEELTLDNSNASQDIPEQQPSSPKRPASYFTAYWLSLLQQKNLIISLATTIIIIFGLMWTSGHNTKNTKSISKKLSSTTTKIYRPKAQKITQRSIATTSHRRKHQRIHPEPKKHMKKSNVSFLDSDTYQDAYINEDESYDNVEQDPIQASLSKDIIDPEDDMELNELEENQRKIKQHLNEEGPDSEVDLFNDEYVE